jgi:phosphatidylcholine synthase
VTEHAPIIDGALLDLVIDYLTYVFVPVFALLSAGLLVGWPGALAAFAVVFASALYFADTRMKTPDKSFSGFPAAWNMVALVIFAIRPDHRTVLVVVTVLTFAMFLPVRFVHPVRTGRWWQLSLPVAIGWTALAGWAAWTDFAQPDWASVALIGTSLYLGTVGAVQQLLGREGVGPG